MIGFRLKKWYFDLITENHDVLYIYFIFTRIAGWYQADISAHFLTHDGEHVRASRKLTQRFPRSNDRIFIGDSFLLRQDSSHNIRFNHKDFSVDLRYISTGSSWEPPETRFPGKNSKLIAWKVPQPAARVEGTIRSGLKAMAAKGLGYQDTVEMNIAPWRLPISELLWGRAHLQSYSVVYNQITTRDGSINRNLLVRKETDCTDTRTNAITCKGDFNSARALLETRDFEIKRGHNPESTLLSAPDFRLELKPKRVLTETLVATEERIKSRPIRQFVSRISGNPIEVKMLSEAILHQGESTLVGDAIHERVVWNWK